MMSSAETERLTTTKPSESNLNGQKHGQIRPPAKEKSRAGRLVMVILLLATGAGIFYAIRKEIISVEHVFEWVKHQLPLHLIHPKADPAALAINLKPVKPWDGMVTLQPHERVAIGLHLAKVKAQTQPLKLALTGRTAYDENTLTRIRPRFDTLVEKVYASPGQRVKKGDPLVDLYSIELASAKSDFQSKFVQWRHDLRLFNLHENLIKATPPAISQQLLVDSQIAENKSRLDYLTARDKLGILGVPAEEIDPLIEGLRDPKAEPVPTDGMQLKAKMTLRSPADGIVIEREVVPGNLYNDTFVLMVIAPLDHLFVWVNVYERDQAKVAIGQKMQIRFPFLEEHLNGTVQYVSTEVAKDTRAIKIRASIPNPEGHLKADMLVKAWLEIPPTEGLTTIPRLAMVVDNGAEYVFVKRSGDASKDEDTKFERRTVAVAQEGSDEVVVSKGLKPDEEVATNGSLILAQLYEDHQMIETGLPQK